MRSWIRGNNTIDNTSSSGPCHTTLVDDVNLSTEQHHSSHHSYSTTIIQSNRGRSRSGRWDTVPQSNGIQLQSSTKPGLHVHSPLPPPNHRYSPPNHHSTSVAILLLPELKTLPSLGGDDNDNDVFAIYQQYQSLQLSCRSLLKQQQEFSPSNSTFTNTLLWDEESSTTTTSSTVVMDLVQFMIRHGTRLPAEETAIFVVHDLLLPILLLLVSTWKEEIKEAPINEGIMESNHPNHQNHRPTTATIHSTNNNRLFRNIIHVIELLLQSPPHASAMLSPITNNTTTTIGSISHRSWTTDQHNDNNHNNDIRSSSGDCSCCCNGNDPNDLIQHPNPPPVVGGTNPVRTQLWYVLQQCLPWTVSCFTRCVQVTQQLDHDHNKNHNHNNDNHSTANGTTRINAGTYPPKHQNITMIHLDLPRITKLLHDTLWTMVIPSSSSSSSSPPPPPPCETSALMDNDQLGPVVALPPPQYMEEVWNMLLVLLEYPTTNQIMTSSVSFIQSILFPIYGNSNSSRINHHHHHDRQDNHPKCTEQQRAYCDFWPSRTTTMTTMTNRKSNFLVALHNFSPLQQLSPSTQQTMWQCATRLLQSMPLSLWLGGNSNHLYKKTSHKKSTFQQNLMDVLEDFTRIAICQVKQLQRTFGKRRYDIIDIPGAAVIRVYIKAIFTCIPFDDPDDDRIDGSTSGLNGVGLELVDTIMSNMDPMYTPIIQECFRGHITTTGPLPRTSPPIEVWFKQNGRSFISDVLTSVMVQLPSSHPSMSLFYDLLRSYPELILQSDLPPEMNVDSSQIDTRRIISSWWNLQHCLEQYCRTEPEMVAQCTERLLLGRQTYMKDIVTTAAAGLVTLDELLEVMLPILDRYITRPEISDHVQGLACSCISYFLTADWNRIMEHSFLTTTDTLHVLDRLFILIQKIQQNCTNGRVSEALQVTCCKSLGNISAALIPSMVMVDSCLIANPTVMNFFMALKQATSLEGTVGRRCMAMFALGNLSHALVSITTPNDFLMMNVDQDVLVELTQLCIQGMSDRNEKLVTNAIRTSSYMAGLLLLLQCQDDPYIKELLRRVITIYIQRIRSAIALESDHGLSHSWKQRMSIRKQGWGSCNALSFLFERNILGSLYSTGTEDDNTAIQSDVITCLVECLESIDTVNEKVVLSACLAFRSIPTISAIVNDNLLGRAMVACSVFLFCDPSNDRNHQPKKKLSIEIESLLGTVLSNSNEATILEALQVDMFVSSLPHLFKWMVVRGDCSPITFQFFAMAFAASTSIIDVNIEQQFINHARSYETSIQCDLLDEI